MSNKQGTQGHTPEKWWVDCSNALSGGFTIIGANNMIVADVPCSSDAHRIVACVNAMQGIPDPERWVHEAKVALKVVENLEKGTVDNGQ